MYFVEKKIKTSPYEEAWEIFVYLCLKPVGETGIASCDLINLSDIKLRSV